MARLVASLAPDGMPSMAQDRLARRPSEVEEFSGALIPRAARHKILVPTCQWLYDEMHRIEAAY
jgi:2-dehydropantoate 2-reductase